MKQEVADFIANHSYINYCEAIIDTNGLISYINPNHVYTLIRETNLPEELVWLLMPTTAMPIEWLIDFTNCIAVWYEGYWKPQEMNEEQARTLKKLINAKIILDKEIGVFPK